MSATKPFQPAAHHARPDPKDRRDHRFAPSLSSVPEATDLDEFLCLGIPVLDQGRERACTGFGLATLIHYLLELQTKANPLSPVSPRMLYEMAKRYDGDSDPAHEGSTARAAIKGWHKHGVCDNELWPYVPEQVDRELTPERARDAERRPLGAYQRVEKDNLFHLRSAVAEKGGLYVTARVHEGWHNVGTDGRVPFTPGHIGAHAFVLVGYDTEGFWFQNSKGPGWGKGGLGRILFEDWSANGQDAWVAGLPSR